LHRVAVIFFSATGTTAKLAEAVHAGAAEIAQAVSCRIEAADMVGGRFVNEEVLRLADAADALAFGSPTYMGGVRWSPFFGSPALCVEAKGRLKRIRP